VKNESILLAEAARFRTLAAEAALSALNYVPGDDKKHAENVRLAREHALRAETCKDAARLIGKGAK